MMFYVMKQMGLVFLITNNEEICVNQQKFVAAGGSF